MTENEKKAIIELQEKYQLHFERGEIEKCKAMIGVFCILNKHLTGNTGWQIKFEGSLYREMENVLIVHPNEKR